MNLSLGSQWAKATDLTPYEAHNDIYSICTYLYKYEFIPMKKIKRSTMLQFILLE